MFEVQTLAVRSSQLEQAAKFLGNGSYGAAGCFFMLSYAVDTTQKVIGTLPYFTMAYSVCRFLRVVAEAVIIFTDNDQAKVQPQRQSQPQPKRTGIVTLTSVQGEDASAQQDAKAEQKESWNKKQIDSIFLGFQFTATVNLLFETANALKSLYLGFVINSVVDLVRAVYKLNKVSGMKGPSAEKIRKDAIANVAIEVVSLTGWVCLACGQPIGWAFLAATVIGYGYKQVAGLGIFGESVRNESSSKSLKNDPAFARGAPGHILGTS